MTAINHKDKFGLEIIHKMSFKSSRGINDQHLYEYMSSLSMEFLLLQGSPVKG